MTPTLLPSAALWQGNCLEILPEIADDSIDLILVDPPQGRTNCDWDVPIPFEPLWKEYRRVLAPHGAVLMMTTKPFTFVAGLSNPTDYRYDWIWEKSKATGWLNAKKRPMVAHEEILVFSPKAPRYFPQMRAGKPYNKGLTKKQSKDDIYNSYSQVVVASDGPRYPRTVIYYKTAESEGEAYHKTAKPIALLDYFIRTYSLPGEMVLDNTMGAGSTGVAALRAGRKFMGIELAEEYFSTAVTRCSQITGDL